MSPRFPARRSILAISSGGGHWIELLRLRPAFEGHFVRYATVDERYRAHLGPDEPLAVIPDVTRWDRLGLVTAAARIGALIARQRPDVIVSTGALPGFFGVVLGRRLGARTIWLDSLANVEELSMSGRNVGPHAHLWLTQWPELAGPRGPEHAGSVLRLEGAAERDASPVRRVFVTVGAQMPFDRLIRAVDAWAADHPEVEVLAQIGPSEYRPRHLEAKRFLPPAEFDAAYEAADLVVGHAGIGTLFAALERGTRVVVLPRESKRRETRNDHQIATARRFAELAAVPVAWTEDELGGLIDRVRGEPPSRRLSGDASEPLLARVRRFLEGC